VQQVFGKKLTAGEKYFMAREAVFRLSNVVPSAARDRARLRQRRFAPRVAEGAQRMPLTTSNGRCARRWTARD